MAPILTVAVSAGELLADIGIGTIVSSGVKNLIKPQAKNALHKVCIFAGEAAITAMVCDKANESVENGVTEAIDMWKVWRENRSLIAVLAEMEAKNNGR